MTAQTAKALHEMMTVAARELLGYEGPITVTICRDRENEPIWCANCGDCWMCSDDEPDDYDPETTDVNSAPPVEGFFYHQTFA